MNRSLVRRAAALFVLSVLLAAPWSAAEARQGNGAASRSLVSQLWSQVTGLWSDIGCILDPHGACMQTDIGCGADPHGGCQDSATSEIGCGLDPNGSCNGSPMSQADIGCGIDPSGGCHQ